MHELLQTSGQGILESIPNEEIVQILMPFVDIFGGAAVGYILAESRGITLRNAAIFGVGAILIGTSGTDIYPIITGGGIILGAGLKAFRPESS